MKRFVLVLVAYAAGDMLAARAEESPAVVPAAARASATVTEGEGGMTREERIGWWREGRFGMFIHWGLYSIPGGVWKDTVRATGYSEWVMYAEKIPAKEYELLAKSFNPVKFDAKAWTAIAQQAGMKYMVLTAKHHDGFSMFKSGVTLYNIVDATPFKRDVTRELSEACRESGVRFGCYYSIDRDWYRPQGPGNRYKQSNVWDYPDSKEEDFDKYFATLAKPQVEELLKEYRPDLLWFDGIDMKSDAQVEDLYRSIRKLSPECVLNSRIQGCRFPATIPPPHCDYISTGDNEIADKLLGFEWENPASMNTSFGFNRNDHNWVEAGQIVSRLVDIVSKGGNYLLNVGPTPEGLIPQPCIDRLMEVGAWMKINGEAIYGTSPWKVFRDGPPSSPGADETPAKGGDAPVDIRFTAKGDSLYAICLSWPEKEVLVRSLGRQGLAGRTIASVRMLGSSDEVKWRQADDGLHLSVPHAQPCRHAFVYHIDFNQK